MDKNEACEAIISAFNNVKSTESQSKQMTDMMAYNALVIAKALGITTEEAINRIYNNVKSGGNIR